MKRWRPTWFTPERVSHHAGDRLIKVYSISCCKCGRKTQTQPGDLSEEALRKLFMQRGWRVGNAPDKHYCPEHLDEKKPVQPVVFKKALGLMSRHERIHEMVLQLVSLIEESGLDDKIREVLTPLQVILEQPPHHRIAPVEMLRPEQKPEPTRSEGVLLRAVQKENTQTYEAASRTSMTDAEAYALAKQYLEDESVSQKKIVVRNGYAAKARIFLKLSKAVNVVRYVPDYETLGALDTAYRAFRKMKDAGTLGPPRVPATAAPVVPAVVPLRASTLPFKKNDLASIVDALSKKIK